MRQDQKNWSVKTCSRPFHDYFGLTHKQFPGLIWVFLHSQMNEFLAPHLFRWTFLQMALAHLILKMKMTIFFVQKHRRLFQLFLIICQFEFVPKNKQFSGPRKGLRVNVINSHWDRSYGKLIFFIKLFEKFESVVNIIRKENGWKQR